MGEVVQIVVFVMTFISCNALPDLSGVHQLTGTWMASTTVPCTYVPAEGFTLHTLSWSLERDSGVSTIFLRDDSGDHILPAIFRGRVSVPKHRPGDASLLIEKLEMPDSGRYTCQVVWRSTDNSLITRELTTTVKVVKVAATKPIIRGAEPGLALPAGASASLSCEASGSPPISYRWFRSGPAGTAELLSSGAQLAWPSLRPSDSGTYFCEAENRAGAGAAQRSDAVQLTVTDLPTTTATVQRNVGTTGGHHSTTARGESSDMEHTVTGSPRVAPSPLLYGPAAALGGAALGALLAAGLGWWRRRRKEEPLYEVAFRSTAEVARLHTEGEVPAKSLQEEAHCNTEKTTTKDRKSPEYENLVTAMESQYETEGM
ncbi:PREDICTED: V-set and immunoglobulin domain-containing protein 4 isoform X3 [Ficedula albicollis]|uniref:V-set and immunoglobulin domain-containing protein 4 isoform X3 n=1 Tax=Ficedula albicollis TaxID=59894 RepID=UPI00035A114E|nr:PREDICTED: V-set and immunoglobulin domain-containing protein 4 isoform X3 [Ficedula albicollis]